MSLALSVRVAKGAPPLLELALRELCATAGVSVIEIPESVEPGLASLPFTLQREGAVRQGHFAFDGSEPWKLTISIGDDSFVTPFAVPGTSAPALRPSLVVLAAAGEGERRTRMAARVVTEARRRGLRLRFAVVDPTPPDALRAIVPDEVFPQLNREEFLRMFAVAGRWVDPSHPEDPVPVTAGVAAAAGAPLLVARGSRLLSSGLSSVYAVDGYYPDAYCDALASPPAVASPPQENAAASAFLEAVRRAFGS